MTDDDRAVLAFAKLQFRHAGTRDTAIRERLGLTPTAYYRRLGVVIDMPEALTLEPVLVHRLRRMRATRLTRRSQGAA